MDHLTSHLIHFTRLAHSTSHLSRFKTSFSFRQQRRFFSDSSNVSPLNRTLSLYASRQNLYTFGGGQNCVLGNGSKQNQVTPTLVNTLKNKRFIDIQAGWCSSFAVTEDYQVYAWGRNDWGNLGMPQTESVLNPTLVTSLNSIPVVSVATGRTHTLFLSEQGKVYSVGNAHFGQTGLGKVGEHENTIVPTQIQGLSDIVAISCGLDHSLALNAGGKVFSWGWNVDGQLGHEEPEYLSEPKQILSLNDTIIKRIYCGFDTTGLISEEGLLYTFGNGAFGQLGHGDEQGTSSPRLVEELAEQFVTMIALGGSQTLALAENENDEQILYSWGMKQDGQLGHGDVNDESYCTTPKAIPFFKGKKIEQIGCGGSYCMALTEDGELFNWGIALFGRLGHGDNLNQLTPKFHSYFATKKITMISCGVDHAMVATTQDEDNVD